ncbi:MAG: hypothetical protein K2X29_08840, partial [Candidatus Obscuribacterales bacterium]|nr:hypothetical protein [Candidatus Obscuribacterales bacterium]
NNRMPTLFKGWVLAFAIPFVFLFAVGVALDYTDLQSESGKDAIYGRPRTSGDYFFMACGTGAVFGVIAGIVGMAGFGCYLLLRSALSRK